MKSTYPYREYEKYPCCKEQVDFWFKLLMDYGNKGQKKRGYCGMIEKMCERWGERRIKQGQMKKQTKVRHAREENWTAKVIKRNKNGCKIEEIYKYREKWRSME